MSSSTPLPPGTVLLVDLDHNLTNLRHGKKHQDVILHPQPSDHPDDPLNWSPSRKLLSTFAQFLYVFIGAITTCCLSPALGDIVNDTGIPLGNINTGTGIMYLFMGWANVVTQSIALNYGRRPVLIVSALATTLITLWTAYVHSTWEWYLNRILLGVAIAPIETLIEISFTDVQFSHQLGFYLAIYNWALWNIPFIAPIASGFVADRYGWEWIIYIVVIISSGCVILLFFTLEETMFYREETHPELTENPMFIKEATQPPLNATVTSNSMDKTQGNSEDKPEPELGDRQTEYTRNTYAQKLKLWGFRDSRQSNGLWQDMYIPFTLVRFHSIVFAGLLVGGSLSWFNVVNGTLALILAGQPYNLSANMIGIFCISCVIGVTIGCFLSGWLSDQLSTRLARRNNGIREPEHRLWLALIPLLLHPAGSILYGVGAFHEVHWVGVAFGLGAISVCLPMGANVAFNYVLDTYKEFGGQAIVTTILFRNTMGFAFSYAVVPMIDSLGLQYCFVTLGFIGMAFWSMCLFMIVYGKRIRTATAAAYWSKVEQTGAVGH